MPFANQCVQGIAFLFKQLAAKISVADIRLVPAAAEPWFINQNDPYVMEHCSLPDESTVRMQVLDAFRNRKSFFHNRQAVLDQHAIGKRAERRVFSYDLERVHDVSKYVHYFTLKKLS
jgi:hypothetical protein